MRIYGISVILSPSSQPATILASASDLSDFPHQTRINYAGLMNFFITIIAERTPQGHRQSVKEQKAYVLHIYNRGGPEQLAGQ